MKVRNRYIIKVYSYIFRKWLLEDYTGDYSKIIFITGIKSFLVETTWGNRYMSTPIIKIGKWEI